MLYPNLYIERHKRKDSMTKIAKDLCMARQTYALKESGEREFTLSEAIKLSKRYGKPLDYLFERSS